MRWFKLFGPIADITQDNLPALKKLNKKKSSWNCVFILNYYFKHTYVWYREETHREINSENHKLDPNWSQKLIYFISRRSLFKQKSVTNGVFFCRGPKIHVPYFMD